MTLESNKNLGGIGAILLFVGTAGMLVEPLLGFAAVLGVILALVGLHGLADYYKENRIFNNGLWAFVAIIVGAVVAVAALFYVVVYTNLLSQIIQIVYPTWDGDWSSLASTPQASAESIDFAALVPLLTPIFEVYALFCVFLVAAGFFIWRSLKQVAAKADIGLFGTAGIMLFIGGLLSFVFLGLVLMWIATLMMAIAFFQLKPQPEQTAVAPAVSPQPASTAPV
jgi:uncharacterized membrane protein